jgi:bacterioferritin-associated ferredoxin
MEPAPVPTSVHAINRCVCSGKTFVELSQFAQRHHCGIDRLGAEFGCGNGCGLCRPYLAAMLASGRTSFDPAESIASLIGL